MHKMGGILNLSGTFELFSYGDVWHVLNNNRTSNINIVLKIILIILPSYHVTPSIDTWVPKQLADN